MIACVRFLEFEDFLRRSGFERRGETERQFLYRRGDELLTVRKPNHQGDLTLQEVDSVCDAADLKPPVFDTHWCD